MEPIALAGLVAVLLVKEAGLPIPVPGDLIVIGAGAALAPELPVAGIGLGLILVAGYLGGAGQFTLMQRGLRRPVLALLQRLGVPRDRVEALAARLRRTGWQGVAVARMTPGVRVGAIAASGVADLQLRVFVRGLVVGNTVFVAAHFVLGFVLGAAAERLVGQLMSSLPALVGAAVVLAAIGLIGWAVVSRARCARRSGASSVQTAAWADAACPACLAVASFAPTDQPDR